MRKGNKMVTLKLCIVLMFAVCYSDEELNITYIEDKMSWNNATSYCFDNGGILESNETIVQEYSVNITNEDVWIGRYKVLTDWAGIWGCYTLEITSSRVTPVSLLDHLECQRRCPTTDYDFFSVKDSTCYCLKNANLKSRVSHENCICSKCGHMYFTIYKQKIRSDEIGVSIRMGEQGFCMAAQCSGAYIKLSVEKCDTDYAVFCGDYGNQIANKFYVDAIRKCRSLKTYIKWYSNAFCPGDGKQKQHWTSITRENKLFSLTIYDRGMHISPLECQVKKGYPSKIEPEKDACNELHSFFCRFGISTDEIVPPVNNLKEENSDNTGTIAGVVITVIAILIICVVLTAIIYQRRKKSRIPAIIKGNNDPSSCVNESAQENRESTLYTEITDISNTDTHLQTAYNITDKHGSSENRGRFQNTHNDLNVTMHNSPEHNQREANEDMQADQSSIYSLAQRTAEDDEPDPYTTNMDYSHLSNVCKKEDNTHHKVYDHLHLSESGGCDPTYDHSNINGSISTDSNYDHFNPTDPDLF